MKNIKFKVVAEMEIVPKPPGSTLKAVSFYLELIGPLDRSKYLKNGLPSGDGVKAATQVMIQALLANVKSAHKTGDWVDFQHIKYIVDELHRGFVHNADAETGVMDR